MCTLEKACFTFPLHCVQLTARVFEYSGNKFAGIERGRYNSELNSGPWH